MKTHCAGVVMAACLACGPAYAQESAPPPHPPGPASPPAETGAWQVTMSFSNVLDANINHAAAPIRSYGAVPSLQVRRERPGASGWGWAYDVALHNYSGTDEWDRISQNVEAFLGHRWTRRLRTETRAEANWKGSSDDRELADTFTVAQRAIYRLSGSTRISVSGAYRYKVYGDDPETTGPSPYVGAKLDQRLRGDVRLTAGYRLQTRQSKSVRDRYRRSAYEVALDGPLGRGGRLSLDLEFRSQRYQRVIKVAGRQVPRIDQRAIAELAYARQLGGRTEVRWMCGFESRWSTDPSKRFVDPTFGMTMGYRLR